MALAAGLLWQGAGVAVPFALGHALDDGVLPGDTRVLLGWCAGILLLGALRWAGGWYRHWWIDRAGIRAAVFVRRRLLARTVDLDETTAGRLGQGQLIARATSDVDVVDGWVRGLATLVTATFTLIAVGIALIALGPQPALVGAAAVPLTIALTARHIRRQRVAAAALAERGGTLTGMVEELIGGAATVKGLRAEPVMAARAGTASRQLREAAMAVERVEASWLAAASLVPGLAVAAGVWLIGELVLDGDLAPGDLVAFVGWMALLVRAVETLTERLITRGAARAAADRLVAVLNAPPAVAEAPDPRPLPPGGAVSVRGVHAVRGGREVLRGIDLEIPDGQWVGLIGPTGSGKTSLLRLLPRLGDPAAGEIRVADELIGGVALPELRARVGYLGQRGVLLAGTLAENLRLTAPDAGDEDLRAALRATAALDLLDVVPGGLAGRIGVGGATLSGGQRQRLCLARTVLARPDVLVLDDPTAALDPVTEAQLLQGLREFLPAATLICATHRVAMARAMDRLVVLADGRVRADGEPAEVLAAGAAGALVLDLAGAR